jgi:chromosome segregation ATPase
MNLDSSVSQSRDPRRRPPINTNLSQNEVAQQRPPSGPWKHPAPEPHRDVSGDRFIRSISNFIEMAVKTRTKVAERDHLLKRTAETKDLLNKASSHAGFPSTVEFYQYTKDGEDKALHSLNSEVQSYETELQELESVLRNQWAASANSRTSTSDDKVRQLEQSLKFANDNISGLHGDIAELIERNKSLDVELKNIQTVLGAQQKSFGTFTHSLGLLKNETDHFSSRLKQIEEKSSIQPDNGITPDTKKLLDDLSNQHRILEQRTAGLGEKDTAIQSLKEKAKSLNTRMDELIEIQRAKDEFYFAEMDTLKQDLDKRLGETQQTQERLTESVKEAMLRVPRERLDPKVDGLFESVRRLGADLESIKVALLSLESRYNNLTTEPIVQHMVRAMHEMYPSVDQLWKELTVHKQSLDQTLPSLARKIEQLETQGKTSALPQDELNSIRAQQEDLKRSIGGLVERHQWLSQEEFRGMQARLEFLAEKQNNADSAFLQKQTADQETLREVERQGTSLSDRLKVLSDAIERLDEDYNLTKENNQGDMQSLQLRMTSIEQSAKVTYENTKKELDRIKKIVQLPEQLSQVDSLNCDSPSGQPRPALRPDLLHADRSQGMKIKRRRSESGEDTSQPTSNSPAPRSPGLNGSRKDSLDESRRKKKKTTRSR